MSSESEGFGTGDIQKKVKRALRESFRENMAQGPRNARKEYEAGLMDHDSCLETSLRPSRGPFRRFATGLKAPHYDFLAAGITILDTVIVSPFMSPVSLTV
jgi:hypothetical protein